MPDSESVEVERLSMNSHSLWQQARDKTQYVLRNGSTYTEWQNTGQL